jgi:hypothetical protein
MRKLQSPVRVGVIAVLLRKDLVIAGTQSQVSQGMPVICKFRRIPAISCN